MSALRQRKIRLAFACALVMAAGVPPSAHAGAPAQPVAQPAALDMTFDGTDAAGDTAPPESAVDESNSEVPFWRSPALRPTRVTLAYEASQKVVSPDYLVKNRASLRVEYSKHLLEHGFLQLDVKQTEFLNDDHRHAEERSDTRVSQAYLQTSFARSSVSLGIQTIGWGESILAPITDEVSPRDNRELFNFNLEELRIGQAMVSVDQYSDLGRWSAFYIPEPSFNQNPGKGSAYYFDPLAGLVPIVKSAQARDPEGEYGMSWRKSIGSADISVMAARLTDNDYALRMDAGRLVQEATRFSLAGMTLSYTVKKFLFKSEVGWKSPQAYNDAQLQIVHKDEVDAYLGVEYRHSATLSLGLEGVNQHVIDWEPAIQSAPRNRQSILLTMTKLMMNDDLSINLLQFMNQPDRSALTMLLTSFKCNDNLTLALNAIHPSTRDQKSGMWNVRDQKQVAFKIQYQF